MKNLILASTSPRRRELFSSLGIAYEAVTPRYEEKATSLSAREECLYHAEHKALSVVIDYPAALILGCDTLVECDGEKIGKPVDAAHARKILQKLSGREHRVFSAVVLLEVGQNPKKHIEEVRVAFRALSSDQIDRYVATEEPIDKAGAYAVQGQGRALIASLEGEEAAAVGLPLEILKSWLSL
jgi:septum formation protein